MSANNTEININYNKNNFLIKYIMNINKWEMKVINLFIIRFRICKEIIEQKFI